MLKVFKISTPIIILFFIFVYTYFVVINPAISSNSQLNVFLGAATFIFGSVSAFLISSSTSRMNEVSRLLNLEDSILVSIYLASLNYGKNIQNKARIFIDGYLIEMIDYTLQDFDKTSESQIKMFNFLISLDPKNNQQTQSYRTFFEVMNKSNENRTRIVSLVKQGMYVYEWLTLIILAVIVVLCIFSLNLQGLLSSALSIFLSTAIVMLLLVIRDINSLEWKNHTWIWKSLHDTFARLDLIPYYPYTIARKKNILEKGEKARLAIYKYPYPNFKDKRIITLDK